MSINFWQKKWVIGLILFLGSLLPRLTAVNRYITPDELIWVYRSVQFREALLAGAWSETLTTGHPGVLTMWLGSIAISLQLLFSAESLPVYEWITRVAWYDPSNIEMFPQLAHFLSAGRIAVAMVNSLGLVGVWLLAERLWSPKVAWLIAGLLALDPFVVGLSGLLHVDGLMTTFTTLSLLSLALTLKEVDKKWVVLGAVTAVCAILSKSPALLLGLVWGLCFVWMRGRGLWSWGQFLRLGFLWVGVLLVTLLVGFPALWSSPADVAGLIQNNANRHIETALRPTFFMGEMAFEHGPIFYPVALLFRLSPLVLLGLLLAGVRSWRGRVSGNQAIWLLWPILFVLAITLAEKKFDRYALPAIPALIIMAGLGWHWGLQTIQKRQWLWGVLGVQLVWLLWVLPYPLLAYNPLVGGLPMAEKVLTVGWGEGVSQAAHWLDEQAPNATAKAGLPLALAPFYTSGETFFEGEADYQIITKTGVQAEPDLWSRMMAEFELVQTVELNGRPHAWLFFDPDAQPFEPAAVTVDDMPFVFDETIALHDRQVTVLDGEVWVTILWERVADPQQYNVQINALDIGRDHVWFSLETALLNQTYFYPEHWAEGEPTAVTYKLPLPKGLPPAPYLIDIKLFEAETGRQTVVRHANGTFYGTAVATSPFNVLPNSTIQIDPASLNLSLVSDKTWGNLRLLGRDPLPDSIATGSELTVDLYWQAMAPLPRNVQLQMQLGEEEPITLPLSHYASEWWQTGDVLHEKYKLPIPVGIDAGETPLRLWVQDGNGRSPINLATLNIVTLDRLFTLPETINVPLTVPFAEVIALQGMDETTIYVSPERPLTLTLYWQVLMPPEQLLNVFIHLLDADGQIVAQADRWPGGLPSDLWAEGQIIVDEYTIPVPATTPNEEFTLAVGLYDPNTGIRLTPQTSLPVEDNRLFLPIPVFAEPPIE